MASLTDLENDTLVLLNEATGSVIGDLPNGTGGTTIATLTVIDQYLNEAQYEMARSCVYIPASQTFTAYTGSDLALTSIWAPMSVSNGTSVLQHTSETRLRSWIPNFEVATGSITLPNGGTTTSPYYWYKKDPLVVRVFPAASNNTLVVRGAGLPPAITTTCTFASDDILRNTLPVYAAMKLAMKNLDDPSLAPRIQLWREWWFDSTMRLWNQLDSSLKMEGSPYQNPPVAPPAAK